MRFDRFKLFFRGLRGRLTLWNTAVVLVLLLVNVLAIREGLIFTIAQMSDEFIAEELYSAIRDLNRLQGQADRLRSRFNLQATGHPRRRLFIQLLSDEGTLMWSSEQSPPANVLPANVVAFDSPETVGEYRIICRRVADAEGQPLTVRVGCSLRRAQGQMSRFTNIMLGASLMVLLAVPLGGYLLAVRAAQPIADIIRATERLQPAHLDQRLPLRGSGGELDQLSQTINRLLDRIAAYLRQSHDFTANAAHELRSPLMAMQSSLEIALNSDRSVEQYKEVLATLLEECGQLRILANQLLLLAEGDAGRLRLHPQPVRLDQIVVRSLEMFQVAAEAVGIELTIRRIEPVTLDGDGSRLWQIVNNLIDNALKFTPAPGRISLDLHFDENSGRGILEVADTGIGIAADDLPHIFDRFYQGNKARERENSCRGLGLGLSICRAVVESHGGSIEVRSTPGQGTTFRVCLPDCTRSDALAHPDDLPASR